MLEIKLYANLGQNFVCARCLEKKSESFLNSVFFFNF